jgi:hypothetical protein
VVIARNLLPKWRGPFRVTQVIGRDGYEISDIPGSVRSGTQYRRVVGVECVDYVRDGLMGNVLVHVVMGVL